MVTCAGMIAMMRQKHAIWRRVGLKNVRTEQPYSMYLQEKQFLADTSGRAELMEQIVLFVVLEGRFIVLMTMKEFILVAVRTMQEIAQEGCVEMKLVRPAVKKNA